MRGAMSANFSNEGAAERRRDEATECKMPGYSGFENETSRTKSTQESIRLELGCPIPVQEPPPVMHREKH